MDRYKLEIVNNHGDRYIRCDPAPDGSWVMFRDVAALEKRCEEAERERDALRRDTSQQVTTDEMVRRLQHLGDWQAADRIEALQKRVAELEGRAVKWAGIVGTLTAERAQLIGVLQIAIERSGDLEPTPSWVDGACAILNRGFLKVDRAALTGGKDE